MDDAEIKPTVVVAESFDTRLREARQRVRKAVETELASMRSDLTVVGEAMRDEFNAVGDVVRGELSAVGNVMRDEIDHMSEEVQQVRKWVVAHVSQAPVFLKWNEFIHRGYRVSTGSKVSLMDCVHSIFSLHNETVNIWSHLFGVALFIALGYMTMSSTEFASTSDVVVFTMFFICAVTMFLSSSIYHTFSCHSQHSCETLLLCDYVGIFFMIFGSTIAALQYMFYCHSEYRFLYQLCVGVGCFAGLVTIGIPYFNEDRNAFLRVIIYVSNVGFAIVPVTHVAMSSSLEEIWPWLGVLVLYALGLFFYVSKIPERLAPGWFDYVVASHQIWHVFIILAALQTYYGIWTTYQARVSSGPCNA